MRLLTALAFLTLAGLAARADGDDPTAAVKKLDGTYEVLDVLVGGKPDKKKDEVKSFVIKDGEITISTGKKDEAVKFTVDPSKKPAHLDIAAGPRSVPGIYEAKDTDKGLELTIAFSKADRPKDFKGEGADVVVMKLLRKKAK
jgi:uncharacterized protein (TIGR03067 family)